MAIMATILEVVIGVQEVLVDLDLLKQIMATIIRVEICIIHRHNKRFMINHPRWICNNNNRCIINRYRMIINKVVFLWVVRWTIICRMKIVRFINRLSIKCRDKIERKTSRIEHFHSNALHWCFCFNRHNDPNAMQQNFNRPHSNMGGNGSAAPSSGGGRWAAIIAERQTNSFGPGAGNNAGGQSSNYSRGGGSYSNNYGSNRNNRDNSGGRFGGQRDNHYNRREQDSHRPFHSHVGSQSSDGMDADWSKLLPANANLERW
jgi:hypothetical protein